MACRKATRLFWSAARLACAGLARFPSRRAAPMEKKSNADEKSDLKKLRARQELYEVLEDEILSIHEDRCLGGGNPAAKPAADSAADAGILPRPDRALIDPAYETERTKAVEDVKKEIRDAVRAANPDAGETAW